MSREEIIQKQQAIEDEILAIQRKIVEADVFIFNCEALISRNERTRKRTTSQMLINSSNRRIEICESRKLRRQKTRIVLDKQLNDKKRELLELNKLMYSSQQLAEQNSVSHKKNIQESFMVNSPSKRIYQVFVSSTYEDLKLERQEVMAAIVSTGNVPIGMEYFPAGNAAPFDYIKKQIDNADYYVLVLAGKYGSINEETGISYTEMEYDYAISRNVPVASFVIKNPLQLKADQYESQDAQKRDLLEAFRKKVCNGRMVKFWEDKKDLRSDIKDSLRAMIEDSPRNGWIQFLPELYNNTLVCSDSEIERLKTENVQLREQISELKKNPQNEELVILDPNFMIRFVTSYDIQVQLNFALSTKTKPVTIKEIQLCNEEGITGYMSDEKTSLGFNTIIPQSIVDINSLTEEDYRFLCKKALETNGVKVQGIHIEEGDVKFFSIICEFDTVRYPDGYEDLPLQNWSLKISYNIDGLCIQHLIPNVIKPKTR